MYLLFSLFLQFLSHLVSLLSVVMTCWNGRLFKQKHNQPSNIHEHTMYMYMYIESMYMYTVQKYHENPWYTQHVYSSTCMHYVVS